MKVKGLGGDFGASFGHRIGRGCSPEGLISASMASVFAAWRSTDAIRGRSGRSGSTPAVAGALVDRFGER
jgi:hypothetical protein